MRGWVGLALVAWLAACGPSTPPSTTSDSSGLPEMIGAEDCGGCRLSAGTCSAYFAVDSAGGEQVQGKEVPCDASCCAGPAPQ